jgi:hypothetical protein
MNHPTTSAQSEIDRYREEKKRDDAFTKWRKRAARRMPQIAARVFALRGHAYPGHGFHYGLEKLLGACLRELNNYDDGSYYHGEDTSVTAAQISLKVIVEELHRRVKEIEEEIEKELRQTS